MKITRILLAAVLMTGATSAIGQEQMLPTTQQEQTPEVSDVELEKFANVYLEVQSESQKMQQEAVKAIEVEGMEIERFNEISQAQNDPSQEVETNEEEVAQLTKINSKIQEIQTSFQSQVVGMIQKKGLTVQRYQELYAAIQQDEELQQKFGELING